MTNLDFFRINWTFNKRTSAGTSSSVALSVTKRKDRYAFIFRDGAAEGLGEYALVGTLDDYLVFTKCDKGGGSYKLSKRSKNDDYREMSVAINRANNKYDDFIGDYAQLHYYAEKPAYYVRKGEKL